MEKIKKRTQKKNQKHTIIKKFKVRSTKLKQLLKQKEKGTKCENKGKRDLVSSFWHFSIVTDTHLHHRIILTEAAIAPGNPLCTNLEGNISKILILYLQICTVLI